MLKSTVLGGVAALATIAVVATGATVVAQDTIAQRKELMKAVGGASKTGSQLAKGDIPYDAAKASEAMGTIAANWEAFTKLLPKGSDTGGETTASPKIWENFKDFETKGQKMASDAATAQKAAASGADAFKGAFGEVAKNCRACHEVYRVQKR
jgi:cytochrome c556